MALLLRDTHCSKDAYQCHQSSHVSLSLQERSEVSGRSECLTQNHHGDLTRRSGRPSVALVASLGLVFLSGRLDYSYIPKGHKIELALVMKPCGSENIRGTEQEAVCEDDVIAGLRVSLGRILSVSCSYTPLFVSQLSLRHVLDGVWKRPCVLSFFPEHFITG